MGLRLTREEVCIGKRNPDLDMGVSGRGGGQLDMLLAFRIRTLSESFGPFVVIRREVLVMFQRHCSEVDRLPKLSRTHLSYQKE